MTALNAAIAFVLLTPAAPATPEPPVDVKECVAKGLKWLAEQQKEEGYWVGRADSQPTATTSMAGLALLMEGSTLKHGTYAPNLRRAVEWMTKNAQSDGLLSSNHRTEINQPIGTHAQALLFLVSAYDVDDDPARREQLGKLLAKAITYAANQQTARGGWGQLMGRAEDFGSTVAMFQALIAARKAGFEVPAKVVERATGYLVIAANTVGEIVLQIGDDTPPSGLRLTAGAASALFMHDGHRPPAFAYWVKNIQTVPVRPWPARANATTMATHLYMARVAHALGENGHRQYAAAKNELKWSTYRETVFRSIKAAQSADGSWVETVPGPVYGSAVALIILQMENDYIPAFAR
jgi:hypothetical protein